ncbi:hypothetical protein FGG78_36825 [Thioclava sp. BHET1]|nr:hypothetical protein FGG78_36825 [Thioclava sp. BHET1]
MILILRVLIAVAITSALGTSWAFWTGAGRSAAPLSWAIALLPLLWLAFALPALRAARPGRAVVEVALGLLGASIAPVLYPAYSTGTGAQEILGFFLWPLLPTPGQLFGVPFATLNAWLWAPRLAALSILLPLVLMGLRWGRAPERTVESAPELRAEAEPVTAEATHVLENVSQSLAKPLEAWGEEASVSSEPVQNDLDLEPIAIPRLPSRRKLPRRTDPIEEQQ